MDNLDPDIIEGEKLINALALSFREEYIETKNYIKTFESIFIDKRVNSDNKKLAKEILEQLYDRRNEYGGKAIFYRKMHSQSTGTPSTIGWCQNKTI